MTSFMTEVTTQMRKGSLLVVREWVLIHQNQNVQLNKQTNNSPVFSIANVITNKYYNVRVILRLKWLK